MNRTTTLIVLIALVLSLGATVLAQDMVELDFMCYENGNECSVYEDLLSRFSEDNPGIAVSVNTVPYTTVRDQLRVQVEAGQAPDIARITDFAGMAGFYLDLRPLMEDPALLEENVPAAILDAFRTDDDMDGLYGFPDAATVTAPFVNATLFEQAGIQMPSDVHGRARLGGLAGGFGRSRERHRLAVFDGDRQQGPPLRRAGHEPGRHFLR